MSTDLPLAVSPKPSETSGASSQLKRPNKAGCSELNQEYHGPGLKGLYSPRCTLTARWGQEKFQQTDNMDALGNRRIEVSFTSSPQTEQMTLVFDIHYFEGYPQQTTRSHVGSRPLQSEDFNTAFYGHLPDGSPAFGQRRAAFRGPSAARDQLSAVDDGAVVGKPCQTAVDGGEADIQGGRSTYLGGLKRLCPLEDVSGAGVKRQRSSKENPAFKTGSRDKGDQSGGDFAAIDQIRM